jgi:hypothetical protein
MTTVRLRPLEGDAPRCTNYGDEHEVRRYERAMRAHRARTENFAVEPLGPRVDGAYRVSGESGASYYVDVVDGSGQHDTCTCPDYLTNDLGTCKHVEAVRRAVNGRRAWRATYASLPREPSGPVVGVHFVETGRAAPLLLGRAPLRTLARAGLKPDGSGGVEPMRSGAWGPGYAGAVRVTYAAPLAYERWRQTRALRERRTLLEAALRRGKMGVDVLKSRLFPYQKDGVAHLLAAGRALLADDMGLGKTVQAIAACEVLRARGEAAHVLVVAPASLKHQWAREIERLTGEHAVVISGGGRERRAGLRSDAPYKILNYELTWRELRHLQRLDADVLVLDEAQRAKNFRTKTAATLRALPSRFLFVLTGTPVENRLDDLYALVQLIDPALFGPLWRFNLDFHDQDGRGKITGYKNLPRLRERIAPVVLRRRKEAVLEQLPALTSQFRFVALEPEQAEVEEDYRREASRILAIAERRPLTKEEHEVLMKLLLKARQACNALELAAPDLGVRASPKLDEFEALVGEIAEQGSSKVLVFSEWVGMLRLAAERLLKLGVGYVMFHGGVPVEQRGARLDRFREDPDLRVLLCTDAGGVGLNLQVATYVLHLDLPWNPARLDQRTGRAHRLGQTRGVSVTYLCAETGIERGIANVLDGKRAVRSAALDADSDVTTLEAPSFALFAQRLRSALGSSVSVPDAGGDPRQGPPPASVATAGGSDVTTLPAEPEAVAPPASGLATELVNTTATTPSSPTTVAANGDQRPSGVAASVGETSQFDGAATSSETPVAARGHGEHTSTAWAQPAAGPARSAPSRRAAERLRLAKVVFEADFYADALRASYEAMASAVGTLVDDGPPSTHQALVAAIYRDLMPAGRLPPAAHATLARLHDLLSLDAQGVEVERELARWALDEAAAWVERLTPSRQV